MKAKLKILNIILCMILIVNTCAVNLVVAKNKMYVLTYHVGAYDMFPESNGKLSVMIDGEKYYYSDDFDAGEVTTKLSKMENNNVVYELHDNEIVKVYSMDEVLSPVIMIEPSVKDGIIYRKGKFSQKSFELVVKVSNNLKENFKKNDLLWFLSDTEKAYLYSTLKKIEIKPSDKVDFGASGWWMWKEYEKTISENVNDIIRIEKTKEYRYTVNLHNSEVINQKQYNIVLYVTPTFDTGVGRREEGKITVGNLDYQEEKTNQKKVTSNSEKTVTQTANTLKGIQNAMQFSKDVFSSDQIKQINEFVNIWMSELILAKYVDKSDLRDKVSEKIAGEWLKKIGINTSTLTIPGEIKATTYLEAQTKVGTRVFIQFNINLLNFDFGKSGMPTMATGSGTTIVYNMNGEKLDSSAIIPAYANVCAFCEQLQKVAKDTIFNGAKKYLGIFGISVESTAEALSSQIMAKVLNDKYTKDAFKMMDAKDVKVVLEKIIADGEKNVNDKIFKLITTPSQGCTEISIKCPVDVRIYDGDGKICGEVNNNVVNSSYEDIFVNVVGEQKNIYLVGNDYSFEMTGTNNGSMDYVVKEFDENGVKSQEITYENVKLTSGCKYYSFVPEAINHSSTLFDLTDREGNIISSTNEKNYDNYEADGKCGENVFWKLFKDEVLYIYGDGDMYHSIPGMAKDSWYYSTITDKRKIKKVIIENGITSIGADAFLHCSGLESVEIPNSVTYIGGSAFDDCNNLKNIKLPKGVTNIEGTAFFNCSGLESVEIPDSVAYIGGSAFGNCNKLKKVNYKGTINQWVEIDFSGYYSNPIYYSNNLYINNQLVTEIDITDANKIAKYAFMNCKGLRNVKIGDSVTAIESHAFCGCVGLEKITIDENVKSIGLMAFNNCNNLVETNYTGKIDKWVEIDFCDEKGWRESNPTKYSKDLYINEQLVTNIKITEAEYIDNNAFINCKSLKNIVIGDSVKSIGEYAFEHCIGIEKVLLGNNVERIGTNAFFDCINLLSIKIPKSVVKMENCGLGQYNYANMYNSGLEGFEMKGYTGTVAEDYAKKWKFKFVDVNSNVRNNNTKNKTTTQHSNITNKSNSTKIKTITKKKKALKLTWKKVKGVKGYQIQYSTSNNFKKAKKVTIKKAKITSKTIKKLKAKKKYYVRIRTYIIVNGKKRYSGWSKIKSQKTKNGEKL